MKYSRICFKILIICLIISLSIPLLFWYNYSQNLQIIQGKERYVNLPFPFEAEISCDRKDVLKINGSLIDKDSRTVSLRNPLAMKATSLGEVNLDVKLFGIIPVKQLTVNVLPEKELYPGGQSVGIKLTSDGVMVVGHNEVEGTYPAKEGGIKKGDSIVAINNTKVEGVDEAADLINKKGSSGKPIEFKVKRDEKIIEQKVSPNYCSETNSYRIGLFIRDTAAGVGTLTFIDPSTNKYGALGHVIVDIDTNKPIDISQGEIVKASIVGIKEAQRGHPGEKTGVFIEQKDIIGTIAKNTELGIFGSLEKMDNKNHHYDEPIPIGLSNEVETGTAEILTVLKGDKIEKFNIEIQRIVNKTSPTNKGFIIKITDEKLLSETGGIIQGMSGSPIIQNGKIVGAVTHVFVNDPAKGYGIFIEWMFLESEILDTQLNNQS